MCDNPYITMATKVCALKTEVIEVILYDCVTWTIAHDDFGAFREAHRGLLHRGLLLRFLSKHTSSRSAPD